MMAKDSMLAWLKSQIVRRNLNEATLKNTPRGPIWVLKARGGSESWWNAYTVSAVLPPPCACEA